MIAIIDYGVGNVRAFVNIYRKLDLECMAASRPEHLDGAQKLVLPGVGAFDDTMQRFLESGMHDAVADRVLNQGTPVLGVCVGMQMLAAGSEEGERRGLGWIGGCVRRLDASKLSHRTRLPHMGWNNIEPVRPSPLLNGIDVSSCFYFLHSYFFECASSADVIAVANYGMPFCCVVGRGNVFGTQFHPEKSHHFGIRVLENFGKM